MLTLDDHTLQLQWDDSKVIKGFQDLERRFAKFKNMDIKSNINANAGAVDGQGKGKNKRVSPISSMQRNTQENQIRDLKVRAERDIARLRKVGTKEANAAIRSLDKVVNSLGKDLIKLSKITDKNSSEFIDFTNSVRKSKGAVQSLGRETSSLTRKMNKQLTVSKGLTSSLNNMARSWLSVFAVISGIGALKRVSAEMENIGVASLLASGNAKQSAKDLEFVGELTERLGLRYKDTAKAFATFNVGAISGGVDAKTAKEVFVQISEGLASAGTNAESAKLAFLGFRQIISGTVVQAQEINQIVDQVPAFSAAAVRALDEMGIRSADHMDKNQKSFKDTIKTAGVDAKEFTKIVARILSDQGKTSGALAEFMQSITAEENRMINATSKAVEAMAESGLEDLFKNTFGGLAHLIMAVTPALQALGFAFGQLSNAIALPFQLIDKLAMALGAEEGTGIQSTIRVLIALILYKLVPSLSTAYRAFATVSTQAILAGRAFLGMGVGAKKAAFSVTALNLAAKSLMRTLWPLLVLEGLFRGGEFLFGDKGNPIQNPTGGSGGGKTQVSNDNSVTVNMTQTDGESPEQFGRRAMGEMGMIANSQIPLT
jgi:tape measure domain-containing protein